MLTSDWLKRLIVGVGLLQATLLVVDVLVALVTGQYLTASLPAVPWFLPGQWMLLFTLRNVDVASPLVTTVFFVSAAVWALATSLFVFAPKRLWWALIGIALLGFWYSPLGIWLGVVEIVLLSSFKLVSERN